MPGRRKASNADEKRRKDAENAAILEKKKTAHSVCSKLSRHL